MGLWPGTPPRFFAAIEQSFYGPVIVTYGMAQMSMGKLFPLCHHQIVVRSPLKRRFAPGPRSASFCLVNANIVRRIGMGIESDKEWISVIERQSFDPAHLAVPRSISSPPTAARTAPD